jgi:diguanylate cyclase (GGDEF)-like protein
MSLKSNWKYPEIAWEFSFHPSFIWTRNLRKIKLDSQKKIKSLYKLKAEDLNEETYYTINYILQEIEKIYLDKSESFKNIKIEQAIKLILTKYKNSLNIWELALYQKVKIQELEKKLFCAEIESNTDHLTKILNRRWIKNELKKSIENKEKKWGDISIMIIDIDYFKNINDNFWHEIWDKTLKELSKIFKEFFKENAIIWRWWWEEFLIILPWTWLLTAQTKANQLVKYVEANLRKNVNNKEIKNNITISIWISQLHDSDSNWKESIKRADLSLYKAKELWRNNAQISI